MVEEEWWRREVEDRSSSAIKKNYRNRKKN